MNSLINNFFVRYYSSISDAIEKAEENGSSIYTEGKRDNYLYMLERETFHFLLKKVRESFSYEGKNPNLYEDYTKIKSRIQYKNPREFFYFVDFYIDLILYLEMVFFYKNSDEESIYAEIIKDDKKILYVKFTDFKAKFQVEQSVVPIPGNIAYSMLEKTHNATIIDISIARTYGKEITNNYKFLKEEVDVQFKEEWESIMFANVLKKISLELEKIFDNYVVKIIPSYLNLKSNHEIDFEEFILKGYYLKK